MIALKIAFLRIKRISKIVEFPWYILIGKRVFKTDMAGYLKWVKKHGNAGGVSMSLAYTLVSPTVHVSTIFMCIDHSHFGALKPVVFETMIFRGGKEIYCERYSTYNKALDGHEEAVKVARRSMVKENKN